MYKWLLRLILRRELKLEKMIMAVSNDIQVVVDGLAALKVAFETKEAADIAVAVAQAHADDQLVVDSATQAAADAKAALDVAVAQHQEDVNALNLALAAAQPS